MSNEEFRLIAMKLNGTVEKPHFHKTSFRASNRIFATFHEEKSEACLMLSPEDQSVFCEIPGTEIFALPNKWGQKGATIFMIEKIDPEIIRHGLECAYLRVKK